MGTRLKEYSYRSQNNLLDFTRRALRDLYCSNTSRNSHSKFSQKCTLPSLYSHCWKTLPLENQNLGSRCMWTRDIWRGTVFTVICSRIPSHLCSIISHSGPSVLCRVFFSAELHNSPKLSAPGWKWGMRMCRINVNGSFPTIVKQQGTLEKNFFAHIWSTLSLAVQNKPVSLRESCPSGMPQE